jgi:glutathione synthase/RimK-type ligase-like ATP-grasp enzyme
MKLYTYNQGSKSAKGLADALGIKRIKHGGRKMKVDVLLNWGASNVTRQIVCDKVLNHPDAIRKASNKLETFKALSQGVCMPEWTESLRDAVRWLAEGSTVVCRHKLTGHSGEGIEIVEGKLPDEAAMPDCPLYVKYIPKQEEYRLHVFEGKVFFVQRKARKKEVEDNAVNWKIRNHQNGFIYAHQNVEVPKQAHQEAINAVAGLGLCFGAVDIIWNKKQDKYYTLEVNTACGLEGTTLEKYVEQFKKYA